MPRDLLSVGEEADQFHASPGRTWDVRDSSLGNVATEPTPSVCAAPSPGGEASAGTFPVIAARSPRLTFLLPPQMPPGTLFFT